MTTRNEIVATARSYIGTPWHHAQRLPGIAIDCAGVVICCGRQRGIWPDIFDVQGYSETPDGSLLPYCDKYLVRITKLMMQAGDVIVLATEEDPQHLGILGNYREGGFSIIHACNARSVKPPRVIETRLMFTRVMRFVAAYSFPGIE